MDPLCVDGLEMLKCQQDLLMIYASPNVFDDFAFGDARVDKTYWMKVFFKKFAQFPQLN